MWQCKECEYFNDKFDELCAKCGAGLAAQDEASRRSSVQTKPGEAGQPGTVAGWQPALAEDPSTGDKPKAADRLLLVGVTIVVIAICIVAYIAYSRGMFPGLKPAPGSMQAQNITIPVSSPTQPAHFLALEDLEDGLILPRPQAKKLATYTIKLEEAWVSLVGKQPIQVQPGQLSADSLAELTGLEAVGNQLVLAYQEFEAYINETNSPHLNEAAVLMRGQFREALSLLVSTISNYRGQDLTGIHQTYLLADTVPTVVEEFGWLDAQPFREMWVGAGYAVKQLKLDLKYEEHYLQLAARYDGLELVHNEFNGAINQIPPTKIRGGTIGKNAKEYLEALDAYAAVVEEFAVEFEEFVLTLEDLEPSDKLERYIKMNRELAQEDHLFCFMEIYMMYAKDKNLTHPVYQNLGAHYEFVQETWPKLASNYKGVYRYYEQEWVLFWRPDLLGK